MTGRRGLFLALALLVLGAVLVLATSGQARWSASGAGLSGSTAPATTALALVALAGTGLLLLLRGRSRSAVGALLALVGVAIIVANSRASRGGAWFAYTPLRNVVHLERTPWFWLSAAGGVLVALGGVAVVTWGHRWPGPRRDYGARSEPPPRHQDAWTALDHGEDPTV